MFIKTFTNSKFVKVCGIPNYPQCQFQVWKTFTVLISNLLKLFIESLISWSNRKNGSIINKIKPVFLLKDNCLSQRFHSFHPTYITLYTFWSRINYIKAVGKRYIIHHIKWYEMKLYDDNYWCCDFITYISVFFIRACLRVNKVKC